MGGRGAGGGGKKGGGGGGGSAKSTKERLRIELDAAVAKQRRAVSRIGPSVKNTKAYKRQAAKIRELKRRFQAAKT